MPNLVFELTRKRYFYSASSDRASLSSKLMFDAKAMPSCDIQIKGKGPLKKGDATFYECKDITDEKAISRIFYVENPDHSHTFSLFAYLPETTFLFLLKSNPEQASVYLTFNTGIESLQAGKSGVAYGPGQGDVVWDVEKEQKVIAESITLAVEFAVTSPSSARDRAAS